MPASVGADRRVVRLTSSTPISRSRTASERLTDCSDLPRWRAAPVKLPLSTTATKAWRSSRRFNRILPLCGSIYHTTGVLLKIAIG